MSPSETILEFKGSGIPPKSSPWLRAGYPAVTDLGTPGHPAGYSADAGLVEAVNTALVLAKPLLLTGRPGTGKSELAERVAWELGIGPVLRFEAQSLTEAQDLFYRFDLIGQMADAQLAQRRDGKPRPPEDFISFGALGKAILYANPLAHPDLIECDRRNELALQAGSLPPGGASPESGILAEARRSVVLIDEIDKAARDVPNDLLNGIERMTFRVRELRGRFITAPTDETLKPIVLLTSNSERDLPEPFLRRCVYYNIPDPTPEKLAEILRLRVPATRLRGPAEDPQARLQLDRLAPLYKALLGFFTEYRDERSSHLAYRPGTAELIDWANALNRFKADPEGSLTDNASVIGQTLSAILKHQDDRPTLIERLKHHGVNLVAPAA